MNNDEDRLLFQEAAQGLINGDFSRLNPLFADQSATGQPCAIVRWFESGFFAEEPKALAEALSCACFNGRVDVARYLLDKGVNPADGDGTGMNAFHWAANRGQLETVRLLIERSAPLEAKNMYGGTVLGCAVWSAIYEPKADHAAIVEALLQAGAQIEAAGYPTGNTKIDEVLQRYCADPNRDREGAGSLTIKEPPPQ